MAHQQDIEQFSKLLAALEAKEVPDSLGIGQEFHDSDLAEVYHRFTAHFSDSVPDSSSNSLSEPTIKNSWHHSNVDDLMDQTPLAAMAWDLNYRMTNWNPAAEETFGYTREEVLGKNVLHLIIPDDEMPGVQQVLEDLTTVRAGFININDNLTKSGKRITCQWGNNILYDSDGNVVGGSAFAQDITERVKKYNEIEQEVRERTASLTRMNQELANEISIRTTIEQALRDSEHRYYALTTMSPVGVWATDASGSYTYINDTCSDLVGIAGADAMGFGWGTYLHPEDREWVAEKWRYKTDHPDSTYSEEYRFLHPNGRLVWVKAQCVSEYDESGEVVGYVGTITDITAQKNIQEMLSQREMAFRSIFEALLDGLVIVDQDDVMQVVNPAYCQMVGYKHKELLGQPVFKIIPPERIEIYKNFKRQIFENHYVHMDGVEIAKSGEHIPSEITGIPFTYQDKPMILTVVRDLRERKEYEQKIAEHETELAHYSRLSTMGEMVSGIAHEVNQPLAMVANYAAGCLERMRNEQVSDQLIEVMQKVALSAERAGEVFHRLKTFLSKGSISKEKVNMNDLICNMMSLLDYQASEDKADIHLKLAHDLPEALVDPIQIEQVLINLIHNAQDVMKEAGMRQRDIYVSSKLENDNVLMVVEDTGPGASEEVKTHLFDPFFTTKAHGMGMGLSITDSIIKRHGGRIEVTNSKYGGLRFVVSLPVSAKEATYA